eukprot:GHRR01019967.1.p1 GENE.GHRR01019967.1~~GHRR01019967.1.p1  ORF type:complete len:254 (+),score=44.03 GHRR01019967.1:80-841(+)
MAIMQCHLLLPAEQICFAKYCQSIQRHTVIVCQVHAYTQRQKATLICVQAYSPTLCCVVVWVQESPFQVQARLLTAAIPKLFKPDCHVRLITENGRSLLAKAGCVASRVEYTKYSGGRHIAVTHVGADLCMRACYFPDSWGLRVFVCDQDGRPKEGNAGVEQTVQDVAGPLCFQGDRLAVRRLMPKAEINDYIVVADVGAYTLSMYSRYNSRCSPAVYGYRRQQDSNGQQHTVLQLLRAGETLDQVLQFWNQL